jgi:hypothetical protein
MHPPRSPSVFPHWSFAGPSRYTRPGGRPATVSEVLAELVATFGLRRRALRQEFAEARRIDRVFADLDLDRSDSPSLDLDSPPPAPPRRRRK